MTIIPNQTLLPALRGTFTFDSLFSTIRAVKVLSCFLLCVSSIFCQPASAQAIYKKNIAGFTYLFNGESAWIDLDNDNDLDIIYAGRTASYQNATWVYENVAGTFMPRSTALAGAGFSAIAAADYDNDGDMDILIAGISAANSQIAILFRNDGGFVFQQQFSFKGVSGGDVAWLDVDNDTDLDVVLAGNYSSNSSNYGTSFYLNTGSGFTAINNTGLPGCQECAIDCADANGDGRVDIAMAGVNGAGLYLNNGNNTFTLDSKSPIRKLSNGGVKWGDFDSDGDLDLLVTGWDANSNGVSLIYENKNGNSGQSLVERTDIKLKGMGVNAHGGIRWCDFDTNGKLDMLITGRAGGSDQTNRRYISSGGGVYSEIQEPEFDPLDDMSLDAGDFDNDGDPDLTFMGYLFALGGSKPISGYFKNTTITGTPKSNTKPEPPIATTFQEKFFRKEIRLQWAQGNDAETPLAGLDYNFYLRTDTKKIIMPAVNYVDGHLLTTNAPNGYGRSGFANNIPEGTLYYAVQSVDGGKMGSLFSTEKEIYHFNGPESISAEIVSESDVKLTWLDNSTLETNFSVVRSIAPTSGFTTVATLPKNSTTLTDHFSFLRETYYYYRVNAYNASHASPYDSLVLIIAEPPTNVAAQAINATQVNVSWKDRSQYEAAYKLERRKVGGTFQTLVTLAPNTEMYIDTAVEPCTNYEYRVSALTGNGSLVPTLVAGAHTNCLPVMTNFTLETLEDTPLPFSLSDFQLRFSDADASDKLTKVTVKSVPLNGKFLLAGVPVTIGQDIAAEQLNTLRFEPDQNFNGVVVYTIQAYDGTDYSTNITTVTVNVISVNDPPMFSVADKKVMDEDFPVEAYITPALENIPYEINDVITFTLTPATSSIVSATVNENTGEVTFKAIKDQFGQIEFILTANDGHTENNSVAKKFTVTVRPINDPPVLGPIEPIDAIAGHAIDPILLTVSDVDNAITDLQWNAYPADDNIITAGNIAFEYEGDQVYMKLMPKRNAGKTGVTLSLSDGVATVFGYFVLTLEQDTLVTGIETSFGQVAVSPNPFADFITISVTDGASRERDVVLTDLFGRDVLQSTLKGTSTQLITKNIAPGIYILTVTDATGKQVQRKLVRE